LNTLTGTSTRRSNMNMHICRMSTTATGTRERNDAGVG
jgi:hypothetical protein